MIRLADGTLRLVRRRWFREEVLIRENCLEHHVIFREGNWQRYQVRVYGTGGELVAQETGWRLDIPHRLRPQYSHTRFSDS